MIPSHTIADRARNALKRMISDGVEPTPINYARYFNGHGHGRAAEDTLPRVPADPDCERRCYDALSAPASTLSEQTTRLLHATATHRERLGQSRQRLEPGHAADWVRMTRSPARREVAALLREISGQMIESVQQAQDTLDQYARHVSELKAEIDRVRMLLRTDDLTGAINRRGRHEAIDRECARSRRANESLIFVAIDLDNFRKINNVYGHPVGDRVLKHFASCVRQVIRQSDVFIRSGGEEFLLLLPGADENGALYVIDRIRRAFRTPLALTPGRSVSASFSAGLCPLLPDESGDSAIERADAALLAAKINGKNCNVIWQPGMSTPSAQER